MTTIAVPAFPPLWVPKRRHITDPLGRLVRHVGGWVGGASQVTAAAAPSYDDHIASLSPLNWWKMQEASGNLADSGSAPTTATPNGTSDYRAAGPGTGDTLYGIDHNGTDEWWSTADILDFEYTEDWSVNFWFRAETIGGSLLGKLGGASNYRGWELTFFGGKVRIQYISINGTNYTRVDGSTSPSTNTWYQISMTVKGSDGSPYGDNVQMYINGVAETMSVDVDNLSATTVNGDTFELARGGSGVAGGKLDGQLCQVSLWRGTIISAEDFLTAYNRGSV